MAIHVHVGAAVQFCCLRDGDQLVLVLIEDGSFLLPGALLRRLLLLADVKLLLCVVSRGIGLLLLVPIFSLVQLLHHQLVQPLVRDLLEVVFQAPLETRALRLANPQSIGKCCQTEVMEVACHLALATHDVVAVLARLIVLRHRPDAANVRLQLRVREAFEAKHFFPEPRRIELVDLVEQLLVQQDLLFYPQHDALLAGCLL